MKDYQIRFAYEYKELSDRARKLQAIIDKHDSYKLNFTLSCPIDLLKRQLVVMKEYMSILEERAKIEEVDLTYFD